MSQLSLAKSKIKVLLLEGVSESAVEVFIQHDYCDVTVLPEALSGKALINALKDVQMIGVRSKTQLTEVVLQHARRLMAVGCFCIGTNQVDLAYCAEQGIPVFNAPFANTRSVAELVIGEILLLLRQVVAKNALLHQGIWQKTAQGAFEARGKTLGIIGYGHIGSQVSVLAESLGMKVIYYDIANKLPLGNAVPMPTLDSVLKAADVVTLHVPQTQATQNLLSADKLHLLKSNAVVVNASRGQVVDLDALADKLRRGELLGAAIDVFPVEPKSNDESFCSPMQNLANVLLTPHVGGSTEEAQVAIGREVAEKLVKYSDNGTSLSAVNFPEVVLPAHEGHVRIMHIHRNQPGVLSRINKLFAEYQVNVAGQYLQTTAELGYLVMDVSLGDYVLSSVKQALKAVAGTVKVRVLFPA